MTFLEERFPCPGCGHDSPLERGHRGPSAGAVWLCEGFARARFACGCSLDYGLCQKHQPMVRGVLNAVYSGSLDRAQIVLIRALSGMPDDEPEYTSFVRSAGPPLIERMAEVAGIPRP